MSQLAERLVRDRATAVAALGMIAVAGYLALLAFAMRSWTYDGWMLLVLGPILLAVGVVIIVAVTRHDDVPLTGLIVLALVVKMGASFVRYIVVFDVYGTGDAGQYDDAGTRIANLFHGGELTIAELIPAETGTNFVRELTGLTYVVMGPSRMGGFLLFSWIAFWGLFLFHRAARIGLPEGDQRRYALLVFFLPSLLFWPASIGKESLMLFALGLVAYGSARILERRPWGWLAAAAGVGAAYLVRPHVAAVVLAALTAALLLRRRGKRPPVLGPATRLLMVGALVVAVSFLLARAVDELLPGSPAPSPEGVEAQAEPGGIEALIDRAASGTDSGGSEIESVLPTSPAEYPYAAFTVLFRPTLIEVDSLTAAIAAVESTALLVLFALSWRRLKNIPLMMVRRPYILMALVYIGIFALAWSSFENLGAIARQRTQVTPFVLLLLSIPLAVDRRGTQRSRQVTPVPQKIQDEPMPLRVVVASQAKRSLGNS